MCGGLITNLPNDLDNNVLERLLGVYVGDSDLTILKVELLYTVIDSL